MINLYKYTLQKIVEYDLDGDLWVYLDKERGIVSIYNEDCLYSVREQDRRRAIATHSLRHNRRKQSNSFRSDRHPEEYDYHDEDFKAGYEAKSQEVKWYEINDPIVEKWKDGRKVDLMINNISPNNTKITKRRVVDMYYCPKIKAWRGDYYIPSYIDITHIMLPMLLSDNNAK